MAPVGGLGDGGQLAGAVEHAAVAVHRLANHGLGVVKPGELAPHGRAGKGVAQRVEQLGGGDLRHEVNQLTVDDGADHALLDIHVFDPHALALLAGLALVLHQQVHAADAGRLRAGALENLQAALRGGVVFQQVAGKLDRRRHARFDLLDDLRAGGERVARGHQHHVHIRVVGRLGQDHVAAQQRRPVGVAQNGVELADFGLADGAVFLAHVGPNGVTGAVRQQLRRGRAAALGHVGHHGRTGEADVCLLEGHGSNFHQV